MLKGALIGFGEVARHGHWPAYVSSRQLEIVAVVDRTARRRELASAIIPGVETFATIQELADSRPAIDFFDICTPPALHFEAVICALSHGWHVLCEKPFLLDVEAVDLVRERSTDSQLAIVPVHNWKHAPIVRRAGELLRRGAIGALQRVHIDTERVQAAPTADTEGTNWRRDVAVSGGGVLMDHGWHAICLALEWFGDRPTAVQASLHWAATDGVDDEAAITMQFPAGLARIDLTWNGDQRRNTMRLIGDAGELVVMDDTLHLCGRSSERTSYRPALSAGSYHPDWFAAMMPEVADAFEDPGLARPHFEEAAECLNVIKQAYGLATAALRFG